MKAALRADLAAREGHVDAVASELRFPAFGLRQLLHRLQGALERLLHAVRATAGFLALVRAEGADTPEQPGHPTLRAEVGGTQSLQRVEVFAGVGERGLKVPLHRRENLGGRSLGELGHGTHEKTGCSGPRQP